MLLSACLYHCAMGCAHAPGHGRYRITAAIRLQAAHTALAAVAWISQVHTIGVKPLRITVIR